MNIVSTIAAAVIAIGAVATTIEAEHVQRALIIDGGKVAVDSKPYAVSVRHSAGGNNFCTGTLIAPSLVLTSGWCGRFNPEYVAVGTRYINGTEDGEQIKVKSVLRHTVPGDSVVPVYDFTALVLESPSKYPHAALPAANAPVAINTQAKVMSWGETSSSEGVLRIVELDVLSNDACSPFALSTDVCASDVKGNGICNVEIGAPLIVEGNDGDSSDTLIGLTTVSVDCNKSPYNLFSRVSVVVEWIHSITTS